MNATLLIPASAMWPATASAIRLSFCGVLNTHLRAPACGSTILAEAASAIIGTFFSPTMSIIASAAGVIEGPISTSILSSSISLRVLATALVLSVASSSRMYSIFCPAISVGSSATELRWGMPSEAAGPVWETVTPTLIVSATAPAEIVRAISDPRMKPEIGRAISLLPLLHRLGGLQDGLGGRRALSRRGIGPSECPGAAIMPRRAVTNL